MLGCLIPALAQCWSQALDLEPGSLSVITRSTSISRSANQATARCRNPTQVTAFSSGRIPVQRFRWFSRYSRLRPTRASTAAAVDNGIESFSAIWAPVIRDRRNASMTASVSVGSWLMSVAAEMTGWLWVHRCRSGPVTCRWFVPSSQPQLRLGCLSSRRGGHGSTNSLPWNEQRRALP